MGMLVMAGKWANVLERCARPITPSEVVNPLYPVANLTVGNPARECVFSTTASSVLTADMDICGTPGEFESGTIDAPFAAGVSGTGTVDVSATAPHIGTKSARVRSGTAGSARLVLTLELKTGHRYRFECWGRNTSGGGGVQQFLVVYNRDTGRYLQSSGGGWGGAIGLIPRQSATYGLMELAFTVESFADVGNKDTCSVEIAATVTDNVNEYVYFDDVAIWSEVDTVAIFGHNLGAINSPQIRSSIDNFGASDVLEAFIQNPPARPAAYKKLSASITRRFLRVVLSGTGNPDGPVRIGELWAGQAFVPQRGVSAVMGAPEVSVAHRQIVSDFQIFALSDHPVTSLNLPIQLLTGANYKDFRNEIVERSKGSLFPLVIVPDDVLEPDLIVMGRLAGQQAYRRVPVDQRETALLVDGLPYATVVA